MTDFDRLRELMVTRQIVARGITDTRVLQAMRDVRRHEFVPAEMVSSAYDDGPLPLGHGQTISQPYIVAWMTELLALEPGQVVLEVGTGCGYQTAVLARLARHVYSIERIAVLSRQAALNLQRAGLDNVTLKVGDGRLGWPEHAPFARILAAAATGAVPEALTRQLVPGGVLVMPVGSRGAQQMLRMRKAADGTLTSEALGPVAFVPLLEGELRN